MRIINPSRFTVTCESSPPVLVPGLDLCVAEAQLGRQLHPVLYTQVLLSLEALLQCLQLMVGEGGPRLALLLAQAAVALAYTIFVLVPCNPKTPITGLITDQFYWRFRHIIQLDFSTHLWKPPRV